MKYLNLGRKIKFPTNFSGKFIKFDPKVKSIVSKGENLEDNFKNKSLLVIYPYPSKGRLNSKLSDDILSKLNIGKEILEADKINQETDELSFREIFRLKYKNNLDEIVGISEIDEKETIEFVKKHKISNVSFLIDPKNSFNKVNYLDNRYEMILENFNILEYRKDPDNLDLCLYIFFSLYFLIFFLIFLMSSYYVIFSRYLENMRIEKHLKKTIDFKSFV